MTRPARTLAFLILFLGGYNAVLPVVEESVSIPAIFTPIQVVHGVFLRDAFLLVYLGLSLVTGALGRIRFQREERSFALQVAGLACAGVLSAVVNLTTLFDVGEALHLLVFAAYFCAVVHWASNLGAARLLRYFLVGITVGGAINLYFTFNIQFMTIGILPFLLGQNGPGGYLGLSVVLGSWLMLIRRNRADTLAAITVSLIGLFASTISYSRLAMVMAASGLVGWAAVATLSNAGRRNRYGGALLGLALTISAFLTVTPLGRDYVESVSGFVNNKFAIIDINDENSVGTRYMYFWGVFEIFQKHPIAGVGYSGFYDAVTSTAYYPTSAMAEEDAASGAQGLSNPHNAFLYYVSANGVLGLVLIVAIFVSFLRILGRSLVPYGVAGRVVWACLAVAYFVNAMTLPTLYNTEIMYLPAALAFAEVRRHVRTPAFSPVRRLWFARTA
ncbi:MAG: O-antigen ligase family protein [Vicinamibacterales bacterium]